MTDTEAGLGMVVGMIASKVGAKGAMKVTENTVRAASKKMFGKEIGQLDKAEIYRLGEALMEEGIGKKTMEIGGYIWRKDKKDGAVPDNSILELSCGPCARAV